MKRLFTVVAMLAVLMAGFMSVCAADENCAPETSHASTSSHTSMHGKAPVKETQQDHCGMLCHVAPHNMPQSLTEAVVTRMGEDRIHSSDDTIRLGLYTVLDQPPRA